MKNILGWLFVIAGIALGLYVGLFLMFIKPIMDVCIAFDAGTLTGALVGFSVIKCTFAGLVGSVIAAVGINIGAELLDY